MTSKKLILVVDDDPAIIVSVKAALETHGYEVITATDGEEGFRKAQQDIPNLIVMDILMPKLSGFMTLGMIRASGLDEVPIVIMTASDEARHEAYAQMHGVVAFLHKPFSMDKLVEAVRQQLS